MAKVERASLKAAGAPARALPSGWGLGFSLLAVAIAAAAAGLAMKGQLLAWGLFALAGGLLAISGRQGSQAWGELPGRAQARQPWEPFFVVGLLILAWAFRFHDLRNSPPGAHGHEGEMVGHLYNYLSHVPYLPHVGDGNILWPSLIFYQGKAAAQWFGHLPEVWRYPGALWGVLGVLAFYATARLFCAPWVAAVGALLFNAAQLNLAISRNFFPGSLLFVAVLGGFALLVMGIRSGKAWQYFGGGFLAGLSLHGYVPGRPVALLFALWLGWLWLVQRQALPKARQQLWFWLGFVACAGPVLWFMASKWRLYWEYVDTMNPNSQRGIADYLRTFLENLRPYAQAPFYRGDVSAAEDAPLRPLFDPFTAALIGLGIFYAVALCWRPVNAYVLALLVVGLGSSVLGGGFSHPTGRRLMLALPPLFLLGAFALERLRLNLAAWGRPAVAGLAVAAFGLAAYSNARSWDWYFHGYAKHPDVVLQRSYRTFVAGEAMRAQPETEVLITPLVTGFVSTMMLLPKAPHAPFRGLEDLAQAKGQKDLLLLAEPWVRALEPVFRDLAPGLQVQSHARPGGPDHTGETEILRSYRFPAAEVRGLFGLLAGRERVPVFEAGLPAGWAGRTVALEGTLFVPGARQDVRVGLGSAAWELRIDGRRLGAGTVAALDGGMHRLELRGSVPAGGGPLGLSLVYPEGDLVQQRRVLAWKASQGVVMELRRSEAPAVPELRRVESALGQYHYDNTYLPVPFRARYKAWLRPGASADAAISALAGIEGSVRVDGRLAYERKGGADATVIPVRLQAGRDHALEAEFTICPGMECRAPSLRLSINGAPAEPFPETWLRPRP